MRNLPRPTFSEKENSNMLWSYKAFGVNQIPSDDHVKTVAQVLQHLYGVSTISFKGALGHVYYLNNVLQLIAQVSRVALHRLCLKEALGDGKPICAPPS